MKRGGDSGKNMQSTAAKKGAQQESFTIPRLPSTMNEPNLMHRAGYDRGAPFGASPKDSSKMGDPTRTRIVAGGLGGNGKSVNVAATYGRGENDGSKPSPRKKAW